MFCRDCGEKLSLRFLAGEGLVPYCPRCEAFKFALFPAAVLMIVTDRKEQKILLAQHEGEEVYKLLAGYVKKGENVEKTIPREIREETGLSAVKWRYYGSRYHDAKDVLMLQFVVTVDKGEITLGEELSDARWCSFEEAKDLIVRGSMAENFLNSFLNEIGKRKG